MTTPRKLVAVDNFKRPVSCLGLCSSDLSAPKTAAMARLTVSLALLAVMACFAVNYVQGYCCNKKAPNIASHIAFCQDCEDKEWCCARGACNIFCCNCEGGCRQGNCWSRSRGRRDLLNMLTGNISLASKEKTGHSIVKEGDFNGDGLLSVDEAHSFLERRGAPSTHYRGKRDLHDLDVDGDSYLSPLEIDRDAGDLEF